METHLPILLIVVPLLTAPLCVLLRHRTLTWILALLAAWTVLVNALYNLDITKTRE